MKHTVKIFCVCAALFAAVLTGCAKGPKTLAEETFELAGEAASGLLDEGKLADIEKRAKALQNQVEALSEEDRKKYAEELFGIAGAGIEGALNSAGEAITNAVNSEAASDAADAVKGFFDSAIEQAQGISEEDVQNALRNAAEAAGNAVQNAADALKALGN